MEASKKNGVVIKKANDHWAFLEHIEAPMWADLTLEANSGSEDTSDDDWFNTSHPFHQWSARELKSKFSHPGEEIVTSRVDLQGPVSPELPSSVSRSRGKHYNSKKWEGINLNILLDKQQGLSRRCFQPGSSLGQEVPKTKSNVGRPKGLLSAKLGLTFERNARGKTKSMVSCSNPVSSSSSVNNKTGESTTRSTITSENTLQQQEYKEVSSRTCDQKSRSLSGRSKSYITNKTSRVLRQQKYVEVSSQPCDQKSRSSSVSSVSLRKSFITGKASKVQIGVDSMQSKGRKSSSGKSSVGSCSNLGYEVMFVPKQQRERITDEKDVVTMNLADKNGCNTGNKSKTSAILVERAKSGNGKGSNISYAKPAYHRTTNSLVQYPSIRSRAMLPGKVNKEKSCTGTKEKLGISKVNSMTGKGKENATRNVTVNQKCNKRGVPAGGMLKNRRTTEHDSLQKDDIAGSGALTTLGKVTDQREAKNPTNLARRIYLRVGDKFWLLFPTEILPLILLAIPFCGFFIIILRCNSRSHNTRARAKYRYNFS